MTVVALVKSGQVGSSLLTNLQEDTAGAQALLEKAKSSSECSPDLGMPITGSEPLKTMQQVFMTESRKDEIIEAFVPLRDLPGISLMGIRDCFGVSDMTWVGSQNRIGSFSIKAGTDLQTQGMTNVAPLKFDFNDFVNCYDPVDGFYLPVVNTGYDPATGVFDIKKDGIVYFNGQFNFVMLPENLVDTSLYTGGDTKFLPYLHPTFLGTRGANECPYRLSYQVYTDAGADNSVPNIFRTETLFEGKFTHYDVAKNAEKRHGFSVQIRCKAGDKIRFMFERGRSIATYSGKSDAIKASRYLNETTNLNSGANISIVNTIAVVFLVD